MQPSVPHGRALLAACRMAHTASGQARPLRAATVGEARPARAAHIVQDCARKFTRSDMLATTEFTITRMNTHSRAHMLVADVAPSSKVSKCA